MLAVLVMRGTIAPAFGGNAASSVSEKAPPLPVVGVPGAVAPEDELLSVTPETAREMNAARPFTDKPIVKALPLIAASRGEDRERAVTCLAIAALYEAGGAEDDQLPVMQVVLNRARHPAFPNSVCGVVFQGSERVTGCQFSFACDGSLYRWRPSPTSMTRVRKLADAMLNGRIDKRVGLATHYHTDWVLPYWSASLEKLVGVRTHLFFVWKGYWGGRSAFAKQISITEPSVRQLGSYSAAHAIATPDEIVIETVPEAAEPDTVGPAAPPAAPRVPVTQSVTGAEIEVPLLRLPAQAGAQPGRWAVDAVSLCGAKPDCRVVGWSVPGAAPASLDAASLAQSPPDLLYIQELRNRVRQAYWDCGKWSKAATNRCLKGPADTVALIYGN